jgi:hypothetical protein
MGYNKYYKQDIFTFCVKNFKYLSIFKNVRNLNDFKMNFKVSLPNVDIPP